MDISIEQANQEMNTAINQGQQVVRTEPFVFEWRLNPADFKKSIFNKKKMVEYVDIRKVNGFIKNHMGINYAGIRRYENLMKKYKDELKWMEDYKNLYNRRTGNFKTGYYLPKHGWGRIIPNDYLSLCISHRPTRHSLADDEYIDLDMYSCQVQVVFDICRQHDIRMPGLGQYINNREGILREIMNNHGVSRDMAKKLPIVLMFGGCYDGWLRENNISTSEKLPLIEEIENEMVTVINTVYEGNKNTIEKSVLK